MKRHLQALIQDCRGNIAVTFCLMLVTLMTAVGISIDYARAFNYRAEMQADLDTALLSAVKEVGSSDSAKIEAAIRNWFAAQSDLGGFTYKLGDLAIDATSHNLTASASMTVPTTLLSIANVDGIDISVTSTVAGISASFLNVYIVVDKSASMMLAATQTDQDLFRAQTGCAFACHEPEGTFTYKGKKYYTHYDLAKAMNLTLRSDVAVTAVGKVLDLIDVYDPQHTQIKTGFYTIGQTAIEAMAPTNSTTAARTALKSNTMTSATSEQATYFDLSFTALKSLVGTAGDGKSAASPLKLVLLLTDGVQSERNWVLQSSSGIRFPPSPSSVGTLQKDVTPLNPDWCTPIKTQGATFGVLYTEYLPMTWDWGYNATVGEKMSTSYFKSVWKGTYASSYASKTRQSYIPVALTACASNSGLFIQASSTTDIVNGLSKLFRQYFDKVRVTN